MGISVGIIFLLIVFLLHKVNDIFNAVKLFGSKPFFVGIIITWNQQITFKYKHLVGWVLLSDISVKLIMDYPHNLFQFDVLRLANQRW